MKAAVLLAALAFANTCTTTGGPVEPRTIRTGAYAAAKPEQKQAVAALTEADYRRLWPSLIGGEEPPAVDFASESVVFLLGGAKPTGGWSVVPRGATLEGTTVVIDAVVQGPPPDSMTTQAFTSPFAVIAVKSKDFTDVRW
jgi:PrcB C-terminal